MLNGKGMRAFVWIGTLAMFGFLHSPRCRSLRCNLFFYGTDRWLGICGWPSAFLLHAFPGFVEYAVGIHLLHCVVIDSDCEDLIATDH